MSINLMIKFALYKNSYKYCIWRRTYFFDFLKLLKKNDPQYEKIEHTNVVIRIRKSKYRQYNGQKRKGKQRSTKHYTENTMDQREPHKNREPTQVHQKRKQSLLY